MNIKALIKKYEAVECVVGIVSGKTILKTVLRDLKQLDEPQKVKVPQFVAEWIEEARKACKDVAELFEFDFTNDEVRKWFMQERPFDLVARAWLDGYEVEKEKRYFVSLNNGQPLTKTQSGKVLYFNQNIITGNYKFTRKELEEGMKNQSKRIKIPMEIRPFDVGYRIVNKHGQALALKNGASIFALPSLAEKAIKKEFSKNDPDFDIEKHFVEEVAIVNLSKFHSYFEDRV